MDGETRALTRTKPGIFQPCGFGEDPDEAPFVKELSATYLGPSHGRALRKWSAARASATSGHGAQPALIASPLPACPLGVVQHPGHDRDRWVGLRQVTDDQPWTQLLGSMRMRVLTKKSS